jgi:hypothetical protein
VWAAFSTTGTPLTTTVVDCRKGIDADVARSLKSAGSNGDFAGWKENMGAIFRCGALTDAGKLALSPM